jgi:hypothetical protein
LIAKIPGQEACNAAAAQDDKNYNDHYYQGSVLLLWFGYWSDGRTKIVGHV